MLRDAVYVGALGASTAVGRDAWSSAAAVRAGISGFAVHPFLVDTCGAPILIAAVPWLDVALSGRERFEALLVPAVEEALSPINSEPDARSFRCGLTLGLPSQRPGVPPDLERHLRTAISRRFPSQFTAIATFPNGHAAGLWGMSTACQKIREGALDACVVAGVDSYIVPEALEWLEQADQLHGAGPLNNAWGFVPGEAAGAVLLVSWEIAAHLHAPPLARVLGFGIAREQNRIKTATVCTGEGLTSAFRHALESLPPGARVTDTVCDMNGEPYRADEFGFASLRTRESFAAASEFVAPADCWGDVSAAFGPLGIVLASIASGKRYANGRFGFVWASSESGERGAVLLDSDTHLSTS